MATPVVSTSKIVDKYSKGAAWLSKMGWKE